MFVVLVPPDVSHSNDYRIVGITFGCGKCVLSIEAQLDICFIYVAIPPPFA